MDERPRSNVFTLHGEKRWRAVVEYEHANGPVTLQHLFEELSELPGLIERGPDWSALIRCTITLNRPDDGSGQNRMAQGVRRGTGG
jgi:hypothetical protein